MSCRCHGPHCLSESVSVRLFYGAAHAMGPGCCEAAPGCAGIWFRHAEPPSCHARRTLRPEIVCTILHYTILYYTVPHYTTLHYTTLYHTVLHYTTLHYTVLHCTTLYYTALHYTTLHYTALHYTTLYCTTLHYTTLHYTARKINSFGEPLHGRYPT